MRLNPIKWHVKNITFDVAVGIETGQGTARGLTKAHLLHSTILFCDKVGQTILAFDEMLLKIMLQGWISGGLY